MLPDVGDAGRQEFQRAAVVTWVGVLLSPLLPVITIVAVLVSHHRHSVLGVLTGQILAGGIWGGLMVWFMLRYSEYAYATPLVAVVLHNQLVGWERTHGETLWWRAGFASRGRHYFVG